MKIKVELTKKETTTKEVELPYYYKHDLYSDYGENVIYGKITKDKVITIQEIDTLREHREIKSYEIEENNYWDNSYFYDEYNSNKEEFDNVRERAKSFLNCF